MPAVILSGGPHHGRTVELKGLAVALLIDATATDTDTLVQESLDPVDSDDSDADFAVYAMESPTVATFIGCTGVSPRPTQNGISQRLA